MNNELHVSQTNIQNSKQMRWMFVQNENNMRRPEQYCRLKSWVAIARKSPAAGQAVTFKVSQHKYISTSFRENEIETK